MNISPSVISLSVGVGFHLIPKVLSKIFPRREDQYIAHIARHVIRDTFEKIIEKLGEKTQRIYHVLTYSPLLKQGGSNRTYLADSQRLSGFSLQHPLPRLQTIYL